MSEFKKHQDGKEESIDETTDVTTELDLDALLKKAFDENPEYKSIYESVTGILGENIDNEEEEEIECYEIGGHEYLLCKKIEIAGTTYLYLLNEDDVLDFIIQKLVVEDGEEYVTDLDSDKEFELVLAYIQRDYMLQIKEKMKNNDDDNK